MRRTGHVRTHGESFTEFCLCASFARTVRFATHMLGLKHMTRSTRKPRPSVDRDSTAQPTTTRAFFSAGRPLDHEAQAFFGSRFAFNFANVRIHDDAAANRMAADANAHAFTIGEDIAFAQGKSETTSSDGKARLAHELTHVVQAARHPVAAANAPPESVSNPGDPAEHEAAAVASQVIAGGMARVQAAPHAAVHRQPAPKAKEKTSWLERHKENQLHVFELISDTLAVNPSTLTNPPPVGTLPPIPDPKQPQKRPQEPFSFAQLAPDPHQQFINTAQWIEDKTSDGTLSFVILSPTHHPDKGGLRPFFDATVKYPGRGGDYPETAIDPTTPHPQVVWESPSTGGERSSSRGEIRLFMGGSTDDAAIRRRLIHEVQHVADRGDEEIGRAAEAAIKDRPPDVAPGSKADDARLSKSRNSAVLWARYKSEFRAYWIQSWTESDRGYAPLTGGMSPGDGTRLGNPLNQYAPSIEVSLPATDRNPCTPNKRTATFANERQRAIFDHLMKNDASYKFVRPYVCDADFSAKVNAYTEPSGVNLVNSVRLDQLSTALRDCDKSLKVDHSAVALVLAAADALDSVDRAFLRLPEAKPFWDNAGAQLSSVVLTTLRKRVN